MPFRDLFTKRRGDSRRKGPSCAPTHPTPSAGQQGRSQQRPYVAPSTSSTKNTRAATAAPRLDAQHNPSRVDGSSDYERRGQREGRGSLYSDATTSPLDHGRPMRQWTPSACLENSHPAPQVNSAHPERKFARTAPTKPPFVFDERLRNEPREAKDLPPPPPSERREDRQPQQGDKESKATISHVYLQQIQRNQIPVRVPVRSKAPPLQSMSSQGSKAVPSPRSQLTTPHTRPQPPPKANNGPPTAPRTRNGTPAARPSYNGTPVAPPSYNGTPFPVQPKSGTTRGAPLAQPQHVCYASTRPAVASSRNPTSQSLNPLSHTSVRERHHACPVEQFQHITPTAEQARCHNQRCTDAPASMAEHPFFKPRLPPRMSEKTVPQPSNSSDSETESPRSSSSCSASSSTNATSILPELVMPKIPTQEGLRQLPGLGFTAEPAYTYPTVGRVPRFKISENVFGRIDEGLMKIVPEGRNFNFPQVITVRYFLAFEDRRVPDEGEISRHILLRLLLCKEIIPKRDVEYVLQCFYWIKRMLRRPFRRLPPEIRMLCNERQRRILIQFRQGLPKDGVRLARALIGSDAFDDSLRLFAFLELHIRKHGPCNLRGLIDMIKDGKDKLQHAQLTLHQFNLALPECIWNLVGTIVHSLGQRFLHEGCTGREIEEICDGLSIILCTSNQYEIGRLFCNVADQLDGGELTLCFVMLLATGLADAEQFEEMWRCLGFRMAEIGQRIWPSYSKTSTEFQQSMSLTGILHFIYVCGEGIGQLFPCIYKALVHFQLDNTAERAWLGFGGDQGVWRNLVTAAINASNFENDRLDDLTSDRWRDLE